MIRKTATLLAVSALLVSAAQAQDLFITSDTTLNGNYPNGVVIGRDSSNTVNTSPTVGITGGTIQGSPIAVDIYNSSTVNMSGGTIGIGFPGSNYLNAGDQSQVNISGGTLDTVAGMGTSLITVSGSALIHGLESHTGTIDIYGGNIDYLEADGGLINIYGGNINSGFDYTVALFGGPVYVYGVGLTLDQVNDDYAVNGTLQDGTALNNLTFRTFGNGNASQIHLINGQGVPEPGSSALLVPAILGGVTILRRKRTC